MKRYLELLQYSGKLLRQDAEGVRADQSASLARATHETSLESEGARLRGARQTAAWAAGASGVSAIAGFFGAWLVDGESTLPSRILLFLVAAGLTGLTTKFAVHWYELGDKVTTNGRALVDCRAWLRDFDARKYEILTRAKDFAESVNQFERNVLPQATFVWRVVRSAQRAAVGQLIRFSASDEVRHQKVIIERDFLPPELAPIAGMVEEPSNQFQLYRVRRPLDSAKPEVCRWAAYFE